MQHPTTQPDSPFNLLINDLAAMRDRRQIEANARAARMATEAARNRRSAHVRQQQQVKRPLAKAAPVAAPKPIDFDRLAKAQDEILEDMQKSQTLHTQNLIRGHIADLRKAARAGRLTANDAAKLDVFIGQAARLGLKP